MPDNQQEKITSRLDRIKLIMKSVGMSDGIEFAKAIGYSQGYISEILNEKKQVPKTMGQRLEDYLMVNRKWFETGNGEMFIQTGENNLDKADIHYNEDSLSFKHRNRLHENDMQYKVTEFIDLAIPLKGRTEKAHLSLPADYTEPDLKRIIKFIEALT